MVVPPGNVILTILVENIDKKIWRQMKSSGGKMHKK